MSVPSVRFDQARLKVKRAYRHIIETEQVIGTFAGSDICKLIVEHEMHAYEGQIRIEVTKQLPQEIALPIGDAIHNLRASLDYIATRIMGREDNRASFPMHEQRDDLTKSGPFRAIVTAFPDIEGALLDKIRPYKTGNYPLWALGKLDNIDKHKLLIPNFSITKLANIGVRNRDNTFCINNVTVVFGLGKVTAKIADLGGHNGPFEITSNGQPAIAVVFGEGSYFEGCGVTSTLKQLSQLVSGVIETIERAYFGAR